MAIFKHNLLVHVKYLKEVNCAFKGKNISREFTKRKKGGGKGKKGETERALLARILLHNEAKSKTLGKLPQVNKSL